MNPMLPLPGRPGKPVFLAGEPARVALAAAAFFLLLCSYYLLRPVRDEMGVQYGAQRLHWLFTGTFVLALLAVPAFGWVVKRLARRILLPATYGFLISNLLLFCTAFAAGLGSAFLAGLFFVWLSVFNLFAVSLFWSAVSDCFDTGEAQRLYGYVAAGGTAGALAGPAAAVLLSNRLGTAWLLAIAALLLALAAICMVRLRARRAPDSRDHLLPLGGSILAGVGATWRQPALRGVALLVIFYTAVSTTLYVELIELAGRTYAQAGERKAFFASVDLLVNTVSLLLQLFGTRAIVQRYGLRLALPAVPALVCAALAVLAAWGTLAGVVMVQVLHRMGEYAVGRPGREMMFTTVDAESRYKAKSFIDLAVYRANDAASAWLIAAVRSAGLNVFALVGIPMALAWVLISARLGRRHDASHGRRDDETT